MLTILVARRNDLDDGNDFSIWMPDRDAVRFSCVAQAACLLLDHREITRRQSASVKCITDGDGPGLMEVMKLIRSDTRPVMDRHGECP